MDIDTPDDSAETAKAKPDNPVVTTDKHETLPKLALQHTSAPIPADIVDHDIVPHTHVTTHDVPVSLEASPEKKQSSLGRILKRFRSTFSKNSSSDTGNKARKTGQDDTAAVNAGPRASSALSWLSPGRTATPATLRQQQSTGTGSPESARWFTRSPESPLGWTLSTRAASRAASRASASANSRHAQTPDIPSQPLPHGLGHTITNTSSNPRSSPTGDPTPASIGTSPSPPLRWTTAKSRAAQTSHTAHTSQELTSSASTPILRHHAPTPSHDQSAVRDKEPPTIVKRVEKRIVMRVHFHCHQCRCVLGGNGTCLACGHEKCKQCVLSSSRSARGQEEARLAGKGKAKEGTSMSEKLPLLEVEAHRASSRAKTRSPSPTLADIPHLLTRLTSGFRRSEGRQPGPLAAPRHTHVDRISEEVLDEKNIGHFAARERYDQHEREREAQARRDREQARKIKTPRHRIKYTCDRCGSQFSGRLKHCENCGHRRCQACGRWP